MFDGAIPSSRVPDGPAHAAELVVLRDARLEDRQARLGDRDVDDLPAAGDRAPEERREHALDGDHPGEGVAEGDRGARRRLVGVAVDAAQAAHRLGDRGVPGQRRVGPGLPVAGDAAEDEARVGRGEAVVAQVPALEGAGAEVLDDDVGVRDQLQQHLLAARAAQVEGDAALVAPEDGPHEAVAVVVALAPLADRVRAAGGLDLDDVGAVVTEDPRGERARDDRAHLQHAQAREGAGDGGVRVGGRRGHGRHSGRSAPGRVSGAVLPSDGSNVGVAAVGRRRISDARAG